MTSINDPKPETIYFNREQRRKLIKKIKVKDWKEFNSKFIKQKPYIKNEI